MTYEEFCKNVISNIDKLYGNISIVFDISLNELEQIIQHILLINAKDDFYKNIITFNKLFTYFEKTNLLNLRKYLLSIKFKPEDIKELLISTPEIILFSDKLDNIFPIFKASDFKGYALIYNNEYKSYEYFTNSIKYNDSNTLNSIYRVNNSTKKANYYETNVTVESMLDLLSRKDIMAYYGISADSPLLDKFYALSTQYNKRNYYFYKENNPLIALKSKLSALQEDNKYHCDICKNGFDNYNSLRTLHIIPIQAGGSDEVYNISCLCDKCNSFISTNDNKIKYENDLIEALKIRLNKTMPEYLNKINLYFNKQKESSKSK